LFDRVLATWTLLIEELDKLSNISILVQWRTLEGVGLQYAVLGGKFLKSSKDEWDESGGSGGRGQIIVHKRIDNSNWIELESSSSPRVTNKYRQVVHIW